MRTAVVGDHPRVTILELIQKTTAYFEKSGVPNPRLDVELLLAHALKLRRMDLYLQFERELTEGELTILRPMVKRRAAREPLQHIVGTVDFHGVELIVSPAALVPRHETEQLVEAAVSLLGKESRASVLDVGTGTGAILLAIVHAIPGARGVGVDVSGGALELAKANAEKTGLAARIEFRQGDLFEAMKPGEAFDLLVSNPPYIPTGEIPKLQPEVQQDPREALDGGADGLDVIRRLISQGATHLAPGGWLLIEIGHDQAPRVKPLLEENGWIEIRFVNDLQGIARIAQARKKE